MENKDIPTLMQELSVAAFDWLKALLTSNEFLIQFSVLITVTIASYFLSHFIKLKISSRIKSNKNHINLLSSLQNISLQLSAIILLSSYSITAFAFEWPVQFTNTVISLLIAWVIINLASNWAGNTILVKWVKIIVLVIVSLHIFNALDTTMILLDSLAITLGDMRISLHTVAKGIAIFIILLWLSSTLSHATEKRIHKATTLTPSLKVLFSKFTKILLFTISVLIGLNVIGLDLTAFTIFSGAVGVGLGFGLQKVVSNFISGIILLTDRSIKPGDVINIGDTYGWVNSLGARYVSVITRDGKEHLIPNELLITEKVENWSFTNDQVRIRIPIGISYNSDPREAMGLAIEAAKESPRILENPEPKCLVRGFGESSIDLELRFWISDPVNGMGNIQSEILLAIWDKFQEHKIEIPYPQRDVHIKGNEGILSKA